MHLASHGRIGSRLEDTKVQKTNHLEKFQVPGGCWNLEGSLKIEKENPL